MASSMEGQALLTPEQVCDMVPGFSPSLLAQLRFRGTGPRYLKPTPRRVLYNRSDVHDWLESSARTGTSSRAA